MKVESERSYLQLLGFAAASSVKASDSIGDTKCLCASEGSVRSEAAVGSLHAALGASRRVAVGRFVARKSSDPQLVCLLPDPQVPPGCQPRLLLWQLPFADDQRGFTFPSFALAPPSQQASAAQKAAALAVVERFLLHEASVKPELTFNPLSQRLRQTVVARVKDPTCQLPEVDPRVRAYMDPRLESRALAHRGRVGGVGGLFGCTHTHTCVQKKLFCMTGVVDTKVSDKSVSAERLPRERAQRNDHALATGTRLPAFNLPWCVVLCSVFFVSSFCI
jgi:hypothetical protein